MDNHPINTVFELFGEIGKHATIWEFKFRLMCHNLKIDSYQIQNKDDSEILYAPKLSKVIELFYEKHPFFEFDFSWAHRIRNSVAHANFQEFSEIIHEDSSDNLHTPLVVCKTTVPNSVMDLQKDIPKGKLKDVGIFALFLRSINCLTQQESINVFEIANSVIGDLEALRSFSGKNNYFEKLFISGERYNEKDFKLFDNEWSRSSLLKQSGKDFLEKFYHYSTLDI